MHLLDLWTHGSQHEVCEAPPGFPGTLNVVTVLESQPTLIKIITFILERLQSLACLNGFNSNLNDSKANRVLNNFKMCSATEKFRSKKLYSANK